MQVLHALWSFVPGTKTHGQHVQHVNPFNPKPYVCWHHCKGIGLLLLCQQFFTSLAPTCSQQERCGLRSLFHQEGSKPHLPSYSPTTLLGRCGEVAGASLLPLLPHMGKAVPPCSGETPNSVGQQERTSKAVCVSAWGNSPGSGAAGDPAPTPRTVYVF